MTFFGHGMRKGKQIYKFIESSTNYKLQEGLEVDNNTELIIKRKAKRRQVNTQ